MGLSEFLPKKFLGFLPLYIGVEIIFLYGIINKMCGPYGLLSLLTGHPINFVQWLYYIFSTIVLLFYVVGFRTVKTPDINTFSLVTMVYVVDSVVGCLFTVYFVWFWFHSESNAVRPDNSLAKPADAASGVNDGAAAGAAAAANDGAAAEAAAAAAVKLVKRVSDDLSSQSASPQYELFMTVAMTCGTTFVRIYFVLVVLSFFHELVLRSKYDSHYRLRTTANSTGKLKVWMTRAEVKCYETLVRWTS